MSDRVNHCPFLNRADTRCSNHFSLDRLEHAFDHCFGKYKSCSTYLELLVERRVRQSSDEVLQPFDSPMESEPVTAHGNQRYSQVRLPVLRHAAHATPAAPIANRI